MENKSIIGILAVILGILILVFPFISVEVLSIATGLAILLLGIFWIIKSVQLWSTSKAQTVCYIILGLFAIILGIILVGNIPFFDVVMSFTLYIIGFLLVLGGLVGLLTTNATLSKGSGALFTILGIIIIAFGYLSLTNPLYIAIIIALALIVEGLILIKGS
ncbi:MAG: DUF308 domain-containing protein [Methanobrevibacter sp.]|jgi:uncharacterized membrane protein HdeD (DUF308 family)|nr:DUF308 domain-containing protein [Methanobrevibacter sp.]